MCACGTLRRDASNGEFERLSENYRRGSTSKWCLYLVCADVYVFVLQILYVYFWMNACVSALMSVIAFIQCRHLRAAVSNSR